jgi:hypothetical protein
MLQNSRVALTGEFPSVAGVPDAAERQLRIRRDISVNEDHSGGEVPG